MTLAVLANHTGQSIGSLSKIERGHRRPKPETAVRIVEALELDREEALTIALWDRIPEHDAAAERQPLKELARSSPEHLRLFEHQRQHYDFETTELEHSMAIEPNGSAILTQRLAELRRTPMGERSFYEVKHWAANDDGRFRPPSTRTGMLLMDPQPGCMEVVTTQAGANRSYRLKPVDGQAWPASGVTCVVRTELAGAYKPSDAERKPGALRLLLNAITTRLILTVNLPVGYSADEWHARAVTGTSKGMAESTNIINRGVCAAHQLTSEDGRAQLVVEAPLAGYSYGITWLTRSQEDR